MKYYHFKPQYNPDAHMGLMAYLFWAIAFIEFCRGKCVIDFSGLPHMVDNDLKGNPWEYYFDQPYSPCEGDERIDTDGFSEVFGAPAPYKYGFVNGTKNWPLDNYMDARSTYHKYMNNKYRWGALGIDQNIVSILDNNNCLGVQKRGTDTFTCGHGIGQSIPIERYFSAIDSKLHHFDKLLLITDERKSLNAFRERYGDKLIHNDIAVLSDSDTPVHRLNESAFRTGSDVLIDAHFLSKCRYGIIQSSNVSCFARLMQEFPHEYIDYDIKYNG